MQSGTTHTPRPKTRQELAHELGISYRTLLRRIRRAELEIPRNELLNVVHQEAIRRVVLGV